MKWMSRLAACAALADAAVGCKNPDGDVTPACAAQSCAIDQCASRGAPGGRCMPSCVCDGAVTGSCEDTICATACRSYLGAGGGSCSGPTSCECSEVPDGGHDAEDVPPGSYGRMHGTVMSPGGVFPISGALVYLQRASTSVASLPEGNYCPRCIDVSVLPNTLSAPDGTFALEHVALGDWWIIVQKGQFRRVRQITLHNHLEDLTVPQDVTTFPDAHDPANGDTIPHIAVALGVFDHPEDLLAKVSLADLLPDNRASLATAEFDLYDNGGGWGRTPFADLVTDRTRMDQYHLIFVPCSDGTNDALMTDPAVQANIRGWVNDGGKWFVTDRSYGWVEFMFPEAMDMQGEDTSPHAADRCCMYDATGAVHETDLAAWLSALPMGIDPASILFRELEDNICGVGTIMGTDEDGLPVPVPVTILADGPQTDHPCGAGSLPYTVMFPYGCGRVLYSTYHTVGFVDGPHPELFPQELMLLYMAMEIGICTDTVIIW
jgi:hypothetical protein